MSVITITEELLWKIKMRTLQRWLQRKGIFVFAKRKKDVIDKVLEMNLGYQSAIELKILSDLQL